MLYDYLISRYEPAEPIFFSDIEVEGITRSAINQQLAKLCKNGKLMKYDAGVYYLPKTSRLSHVVGPSADMVARYKYIIRNGKVEGFYTGNSFANQLGISTQVPNKVEIVSNLAPASVREVSIGKRQYIVRKPSIPITKENVHALQLLELLKNIETYMDEGYEEAREKLELYISEKDVKGEDVDRYIRSFPVVTFKNYYEMRLYDVFACRG